MREEPRFHASLDLVALPTAVPVARMFIADTLHRWHALFIEEHMEAVAAELVSLAVAATGPAAGTSWSDLTELNRSPCECSVTGDTSSSRSPTRTMKRSFYPITATWMSRPALAWSTPRLTDGVHSWHHGVG
ncbi:hypothetical protein [Amycolatopsis sp. NPDC051071]|uniref:hypothetical protein n=1 Tax=Amycolatopsis sp. NPDC051071 TaxID=3154637 RepID=UPI0034345B54